jgi:hypothetical protein
LQVCWGKKEGNPAVQKFYAEAGSLSFIQPSPMKEAKVSLTTFAENTIGPVVISFKTGDTRWE